MMIAFAYTIDSMFVIDYDEYANAEAKEKQNFKLFLAQKDDAVDGINGFTR